MNHCLLVPELVCGKEEVRRLAVMEFSSPLSVGELYRDLKSGEKTGISNLCVSTFRCEMPSMLQTEFPLRLGGNGLGEFSVQRIMPVIAVKE